ncbi:MAG: hypothetical protein EBZ22_08160, partial [Flavobacteriia bacterium]|nr:hypothetical protein [Flavobacteriia bacterium]
MKNLSILTALVALLAACSTSTPSSDVDQLNVRRDSIAGAIESLKAELAEIDLQLAAADSTRSFASVTTYDVTKGGFDHSFQVYGTVVSD